MIAQKSPFEMSQFRVVKHVTRPLLKLEPGVQYYVKIESAFRQAEQMKNPKKDANGNIIPPPFIVDALNLEGGVPSQMVANEVFRTELIKQYPNDSYVGKFFELIKNTKAEGKNYNTFGITELALVTEEPKQETGLATSKAEAAKPEPAKGAPSKK